MEKEEKELKGGGGKGMGECGGFGDGVRERKVEVRSYCEG